MIRFILRFLLCSALFIITYASFVFFTLFLVITMLQLMGLGG